MTIFVAFAGLIALFAAPTGAAPPPPAPASAPVTGARGAAPGVAVTVFASGLSGPQGLEADGKDAVLVVENGAGRVARLDRRTGKSLGVFAQGLKTPAFAFRLGETLYVGEREANTVAAIDAKGSLTRLEGTVVDPLGLAVHPKAPRNLFVVSHRQSIVHQFASASFDVGTVSSTLVLQPFPFLSPAEGAKYGWRDLAFAADGTLYVADELSGAVLRKRPGGTLEPWATRLSSPSGLAAGPGNTLLVTEEGNGRLTRIDAKGKRTVLAEGLGKAREVLVLDPTTLLVSDRGGGVVYKVTLAR